MTATRRLTTAAASGLAVAATPWPAAAASDSGGTSLEVLLILVAVVGLAYLVTHVLLERVAERFGIVSGIEYVVLGAVIFQYIIAGTLPGIESADTVLDQLRPILVLGTGSLGLMWGLRLSVASPHTQLRSALFPALVLSTVTLGTVALVPSVAILAVWGPARLSALAPFLLTAAAIAMVASDKPIRSLVSFLDAKGPAPAVARRVAHLSSTIAIVAFGLVFCFFNPSSLVAPGPFQWLYWLGVHLVVGGVLGTVFGTFLRREFSAEKILTILIGMVVFSSGLAASLALSPLFVNFLLGVVLINTSRHAGEVRERLEAIEHPIYIVLAIFAGAQLDLGVPYWGWALAVPYLILRIGGRWVGGLLAPVGVSQKAASLPHVGRVLLAPGPLSVAMALDFAMLYVGPQTVDALGVDSATVYGALIAAIVVSEVLAHVTTRDWLIDAADVSPRTAGTASSGSAEGE